MAAPSLDHFQVFSMKKRSLGVNDTKQLLEVEGLKWEEGCLNGGRRKWTSRGGELRRVKALGKGENDTTFSPLHFFWLAFLD